VPERRDYVNQVPPCTKRIDDEEQDRARHGADTGRAVLRFFDWGYRNGAAAAKELGYIPMPTAVVDQVEKTWEKDLKDSGGQKLWPANKQAGK
jgi:hypothetical protein